MHKYSANKQSGMVLLVALIMMLIITIISVTGMEMTQSELMYVGNSQAGASSFAIAETALVDGEADIATNYPGVPLFDWSADLTDGLYFDGEIADITAIWYGNQGHLSGTNGGLYSLEYLGPYTTEGASITFGGGTDANRRFLYRVSGQGTSGRGGARLLQSIYATSE